MRAFSRPRRGHAPIWSDAANAGSARRPQRIAATAQRIDACAQSLRHLNPLGVLDRGYSIVTDDKGAIVQDAGRLAIGDTLNVRFARGEADSKVTRTRSG